MEASRKAKSTIFEQPLSESEQRRRETLLEVDDAEFESEVIDAEVVPIDADKDAIDIEPAPKQQEAAATLVESPIDFSGENSDINMESLLSPDANPRNLASSEMQKHMDAFDRKIRDGEYTLSPDHAQKVQEVEGRQTEMVRAFAEKMARGELALASVEVDANPFDTKKEEQADRAPVGLFARTKAFAGKAIQASVKAMKFMWNAPNRFVSYLDRRHLDNADRVAEERAHAMLTEHAESAMTLAADKGIAEIVAMSSAAEKIDSDLMQTASDALSDSSIDVRFSGDSDRRFQAERTKDIMRGLTTAADRLQKSYDELAKVEGWQFGKSKRMATLKKRIGEYRSHAAAIQEKVNQVFLQERSTQKATADAVASLSENGSGNEALDARLRQLQEFSEDVFSSSAANDDQEQGRAAA